MSLDVKIILFYYVCSPAQFVKHHFLCSIICFIFHLKIGSSIFNVLYYVLYFT